MKQTHRCATVLCQSWARHQEDAWLVNVSPCYTVLALLLYPVHPACLLVRSLRTASGNVEEGPLSTFLAPQQPPSHPSPSSTRAAALRASHCELRVSPRGARLLSQTRTLSRSTSESFSYASLGSFRLGGRRVQLAVFRDGVALHRRLAA